MGFTLSTTQLRYRLKLRQILLLDALGETGSLRQAATRACLTQPAATKCLAELEDSLGVQLFERSHLGVRATIYGETMIRHARRILADIDSAHDDIGELASGAQSAVRIGTLMPMMVELLPSIVGQVKKAFPRMRISIDLAAQEQLLHGLRTGTYDLIFARGLPQDCLNNLRQQALYEEAFVLVTGAHVNVDPESVRLADLLDRSWVLPPPGPMRKQIDTLFLSTCGRLPHDVVETNNLEFKVGYLRDEERYSFITERIARDYTQRGLLKYLGALTTDCLGPHSLIWRGDGFLGPAVEYVIRCTTEAAQKNPRSITSYTEDATTPQTHSSSRSQDDAPLTAPLAERVSLPGLNAQLQSAFGPRALQTLHPDASALN
jgi:DNA-binding transcriptional LysR family regulator